MQKFSFEFKTWHFENFVALSILLIVWYVTGLQPIQLLGTFNVFCGFCYVSISERMRERLAIKTEVEVSCLKMLNVFFLLKEVGWVIYFVLIHAWPPLTGCFLFLCYPWWRKLWRKYYPLNREKI